MPVKSPISRGQTHLYSLSLQAGQFARVRLLQREIDLGLACTGPNGFRLPALSASSYGSESIPVVAQAPGSYRIEVTAAGSDTARGSYEITVSELRAAGPEDEAALRGHLAFFRGGEEESGATGESYARAIALFEQARRLWHEAGDVRSEAQALLRKGKIHHRTGHYDKADRSYRESLALWDVLQDDYGRLEAEKNWANLGGYFGEARTGLPKLLEYLERWRALGDRRGQAVILKSLSTQHLKNGDLDRAREFEVRALALRRVLGNPLGIADSLEGMGKIGVEAGRFEEALRHHQEALRIHQDLGSSLGIAGALAHVAESLRVLGRDEEALDHYQQYLRLSALHGNRWSAMGAHSAVAGLEWRRGRFEAAVSSARQAIAMQVQLSSEIADPASRTGNRGSTLGLTWLVASLLGLHSRSPSSGHDAEALVTLDHQRGLFVADGPAPRLKDIQHMLDPDALILEYWILHEEASGAIWAITSKELTTFPLPQAGTIAAKARRLHGLLSAGDLSASQEAARISKALSELLLRPVAGLLPGKRLFVVSDEHMAFLPIGALPDPNRSDGAPLMVGHEIVYLPSASAVLALRNRRRGPPARRLLAVVADPVFSPRDPRLKAGAPGGADETLDADLQEASRSVGWDLSGTGIPRLLYAEREARQILGLAPPGQASRFVGLDATREALFSRAARRHRILHVATHGFVNAAEPRLSGLILSLVDGKGGPRDGFVRLRDVLTLDLPVDLVTLSACQTALGRETHDHGVIGLTAAFLRAGATRVLSTAWKVDDEATAELMRLFYSGLLGPERLSPPAALRAAQLALAQSERWQSPYYWAAFMLHGDWRPMW